MTLNSAYAEVSATAPLPPALDAKTAAATFTAAGLLLPHLERGQRVDAATLRGTMEAAFGASDATGAWTWKTAYDACEATAVLFLRKYGNVLLRQAVSLRQSCRSSAGSPDFCRRIRAGVVASGAAGA